MKPKLLLLLLAIAGLMAGAFTSVARAEEEVSFDFFYKSLHPYGEWIDAGGDYKLVWHPKDVAEDWAPYTDGYWAYTDSGWTWVSYEDFGGIVYHYGRWVKLEEEGWCWVPDYDWGPAWVSWRKSDDYVGWAPLPPEAHYQADVGISTWVDTSYDIGPGAYRFCRHEDFGAPVIREVLLPRERNVVIIRSSTNITNITVNNFGRPFLGGPRYDFYATRATRPIPTLKIVQETNINNFAVNNFRGSGNRGSVFASVQRGNTLVVPAPLVRRPADFAAIRANYQPAKTIQARPQRGWDMVKAPEERQALKAQFVQEDKGATPQSHHAQAFRPEETAVVPVKADPTAQVPVKGRHENAAGAAQPLPPGQAAPAGGFVRPGQPAAAREERPAAIPGATPAVAAATPVLVGKGKKGRPGATPPIAPGAAETPGTPGTAGGLVRPGQPTVPPGVNPAAPATPAVAGKGKRGQVVTPPVNPATPENTGVPAVPVRPGKANRVETPATPVNPAVPRTEERPATPDRTVVPDRGARPGGFTPPSENPVQPVQPTAPKGRKPGVAPVVPSAPVPSANPAAPGQPVQATPAGKPGKGRKAPEAAVAPDDGAARQAVAARAEQTQQQQARAAAAAQAREAAAVQSRQAAQAQAAQASQVNERRAAAAQQQQAAAQQQAVAQQRAVEARRQGAAAQQQQQAVAQQRAAMAQQQQQAAVQQRAAAVARPAAAQGQPQPQGGRKLTKEQLEALKKQQGQ